MATPMARESDYHRITKGAICESICLCICLHVHIPLLYIYIYEPDTFRVYITAICYLQYIMESKM